MAVQNTTHFFLRRIPTSTQRLTDIEEAPEISWEREFNNDYSDSEKNLALAIEKRNFLNHERILETAASVKFKLDKQLEENKKEIEKLRNETQDNRDKEHPYKFDSKTYEIIAKKIVAAIQEDQQRIKKKTRG